MFTKNLDTLFSIIGYITASVFVLYCLFRTLMAIIRFVVRTNEMNNYYDALVKSLQDEEEKKYNELSSIRGEIRLLNERIDRMR